MSIEGKCEACEHCVKVFNGYLGIERVKNGALVFEGEDRYGIFRDLYCLNGESCEIREGLQGKVLRKV